LDEGEEGYSTILGHDTFTTSNGASSKLLKTFSRDQKEEGKKNGGSEQMATKGGGKHPQNGEHPIGGSGIRLERNRGLFKKNLKHQKLLLNLFV
jgi:hypothetical protein